MKHKWITKIKTIPNLILLRQTSHDSILIQTVKNKSLPRFLANYHRTIREECLFITQLISRKTKLKMTSLHQIKRAQGDEYSIHRTPLKKSITHVSSQNQKWTNRKIFESTQEYLKQWSATSTIDNLPQRSWNDIRNILTLPVTDFIFPDI